jgi:hypothetical protein
MSTRGLLSVKTTMTLLVGGGLVLSLAAPAQANKGFRCPYPRIGAPTYNWAAQEQRFNRSLYQGAWTRSNSTSSTGPQRNTTTQAPREPQR